MITSKDNPVIVEIKDNLGSVLEQLKKLESLVSDSRLFQTIKDLVTQIDEPFMFVIVGEVKSGKSSFINALLESEDDICKVAPSPMTDKIQLITYGERIHEEILSPYVVKRYEPVDILKQVAIVDTPGTNTIIEHHQEITERFIPSADLVIFVFEAKNPYRQSAWEFFDYIHDEWRKKIIFVLQQKDLLPQEDLKINIKGVEKHAREKGIKRPVIFDVSALNEQKNEDNSGFKPLREYILTNITGENAIIQKLQSIHTTGSTITTKINSSLDIRKERYDQDHRFRNEVTEILNSQEEKSTRQLNSFIDHITLTYEEICRDKRRELKNGLSFLGLLKRSFQSAFGKRENIQTWLQKVNESFEQDLKQRLQSRLGEGIIHLSESVQQMGLLVDIKMRENAEITYPKENLFKETYQQRGEIVNELRSSFKSFLQESDNYYDSALFNRDHNVSPNIATGSGIAVIGVILTFITNGMVFDITGGVLTAVGLVFAGVSAGVKRKKILNGFIDATTEGKKQLQSQLTETLGHYIKQLRLKINNTFEGFDHFLKNEASEIELIDTTVEMVKSKLKETDQLISKMA